MRNRMKIRCGLVASSDMTRVKSHRCALERAHEEFINNKAFLAITATAPSEPTENTMVYTTVFGKKVQMSYSIVKSAGFTWSYV